LSNGQFWLDLLTGGLGSQQNKRLSGARLAHFELFFHLVTSLV